MVRSLVLVLVAATSLSACAADTPSAALDATSNASTATTGSSTNTSGATTATTSSATTTTTPSTTTSAPTSANPPSTTLPPPSSTTLPAPPSTTLPAPPAPAPPPPPALSATEAAFDRLAASNPAASMTVRRDGRVVASRASGVTIDGAPATSASPMVVASVSKVLTALTVARLDAVGLIEIDGPVPWAVAGIVTHPTWSNVTIRELLHHTSGVPVVRPEWFRTDGDCRSFLPTILDEPPRRHRGEWTYSNGNYCALGLVVEGIVGRPLDRAVGGVLSDPDDASGLHLTDGGQRPGDVAYALGVDRLDRLGGAGAYIVSTDEIAAAIDAMTDADRSRMSWPGVLVDQYGWGHTGTVDDAKACAWVLENARTVVAVTVAGNSPATGGAVCDRIVEALATDLGIGNGRPERSPPGFPVN